MQKTQQQKGTKKLQRMHCVRVVLLTTLAQKRFVPRGDGLVAGGSAHAQVWLGGGRHDGQVDEGTVPLQLVGVRVPGDRTGL